MEGAVVLIGATGWYMNESGNILLFLLLLLAPDVSMLGYLAGTYAGATIYNLFHSYILPALLVALGLVASAPLLLYLSAIWFAHIGLDRLLGFGLKYPRAFTDTHLQRL